MLIVFPESNLAYEITHEIDEVSWYAHTTWFNSRAHEASGYPRAGLWNSGYVSRAFHDEFIFNSDSLALDIVFVSYMTIESTCL